MTHTDAAQTADLHALPAFAAWARARGFRVGDKALDADGRDFLVVQVYDDKFTGIWGVHMCEDMSTADCRLMASESDLMDHLEYRGLRVVLIETPQSSSASGYIVAAVMGGPVSGVATTRIGALVAAVKAVEEVRE
jgi:hypothetical protein